MNERTARIEALHRRLITFGISVCRSLRGLPRDPVTMHFVPQLARACSAPSAHFAEARSAESQRDFIHKIQVLLKELRETAVWLEYIDELCRKSSERGMMRAECDELIAIFVRSVQTARRREKWEPPR